MIVSAFVATSNQSVSVSVCMCVHACPCVWERGNEWARERERERERSGKAHIQYAVGTEQFFKDNLCHIVSENVPTSYRYKYAVIFF